MMTTSKKYQKLINMMNIHINNNLNNDNAFSTYVVEKLHKFDIWREWCSLYMNEKYNRKYNITRKKILPKFVDFLNKNLNIINPIKL